MPANGETLKSRGHIEVITGSMFSGKSEELIRRLRRAVIAKQEVQVFKPKLDKRRGDDTVNTFDKNKFPALSIAFKDPAEFKSLVNPSTKVIGFDEFQFFDKSFVGVLQDLAMMGKRIIVAGLDVNFRGEPFGAMPDMVVVAEKVDKLHAICVVCGDEASRPQRIINGKPAHYDDPEILLGAEESYEARCRQCHEVPGSPHH